MSHVVSQDGTRIAFECAGSGPPLILVDGAFCHRGFGPCAKFVPQLAPHFTVFTYDRRGRGASGDTAPYAVARELEDLEALIDEAGAPVRLVGFSSGGALALEAAASGLTVEKVIAYEPPYVYEGVTSGRVDHEAQLKARLAADDRSGTVSYFMRDMVGAPAAAVVMMRMMPWIWRKLAAVAGMRLAGAVDRAAAGDRAEDLFRRIALPVSQYWVFKQAPGLGRKLAAVAHTVPYDAAVMAGFEIPRARFAAVRAGTLVVHGSKTDARIQRIATALAAAVPGAHHRVLDGQTHNVKAAALAPLIIEFCAADTAHAGVQQS